MTTYLVCKRMEVRNVNAQPAWWLIAPPGPMAFLGFAHAMNRRAQEPGAAAVVDGVGIVHHHFELLAEHPPGSYLYHPHQFRGASLIDKDDYAGGGARPQLSLQPSARGNLVASVVLRFAEGDALPESRVRQFLRTARLAGGTIEEYLDVDYVHSLDEVHETVNGWGVHERLDLMRPRGAADGAAAGVLVRDPLDALLQATHPSMRTKEPWLIPAALGYATLTAEASRSMVREGYPHAFAEPLVGLVQYRTLRDAELPFWHYAKPHERAYVVTTAADNTVYGAGFDGHRTGEQASTPATPIAA